MDAENKLAGNDQSAALWRLILLALCSVGIALGVVILVLQVVEYRFYRASPSAWPQTGAGAVGAPAVMPLPGSTNAAVVVNP